MILGQTRGYLVGIFAMLIISVWTPNKLAYTESPMKQGDIIDNALVFNSTILRLSAQYDSTEQSINTKVALVDSQSKIISSKIKKLNDNTNKDLAGSSRDSSNNFTGIFTREGLQDFINKYSHYYLDSTIKSYYYY